MRLLSFGLIVVAACGDSQQGALLTVNAPDGPSTASRIEIVLASAKPATIDDIPLQRQRPTDLSGEPVRYYRQRATAGVVPIGANGMDSFAVRLEADGSVPDDALIPFLIARDDSNTIVGIGAYLENDQPAPVTIVPGQLLGYEITMTALTVTAGTNGIGDNQVLTVRCDGFDSGIAWKPGATQFRLLLPDRSNDAAAVDASARTLDMDCDGAEALHDDCDDLRSEFHIGADEVCDGLDYDCDFHRLEVVSCNLSSCNGTPGVQLCADVNAGSTIGGCARDPSCECQVNNNNCNRCAIPFTDAGQQKGLCEPYLSNPITIPGCGIKCSIEVINVPSNPWRALITDGVVQPTTKLIDVINSIKIKADLPDEDTIDAQPGDTVGAVFLAVTPSTSTVPQLVTFAIQLDVGGTTCQASPNPMVCIVGP